MKVYQSTSESLKIVLQIKQIKNKQKITETPLYKMS